MNQKNLDKMAHSMTLIADKALKEGETWEEEDMKKMYKEDAESYLYISNLIKKGALKTAAHTMNNLDTAARDMIKSYVFDTVMKYY